MSDTYKPGDRQPGKAFLQTQEVGGRWVTIVEYYPGNEKQLARAHELAGLMSNAGLSTIVTPPAVTLPTTPGWYRVTDPQSPSANRLDVIQLLATGDWVTSDDGYYIPSDRLARIRKFVLLAPVAETAQEVIDWLQARLTGRICNFDGDLAEAREHFGVEER